MLRKPTRKPTPPIKAKHDLPTRLAEEIATTLRLSQHDSVFFPRNKKLPSGPDLTCKNLIDKKIPGDGFILRLKTKNQNKEKFELIGNEKIGSGRFSKILASLGTLVFDKETQIFYLRFKNKVVKIQSHSEVHPAASVLNEHRCMLSGASPSLNPKPPTVCKINHTEFSFLLMDRLPGKELFSEIIHNQYLYTSQGKLATALKVVKQVVRMHKLNTQDPVIHADVKPENFIFNILDLNNNRVKATLIDYGLARFTSNSKSDILSGTTSFLDPLLLEGNPNEPFVYSHKNDDFSTFLSILIFLDDHFWDFKEFKKQWREKHDKKIDMVSAIKKVNKKRYEDLSIDNLMLPQPLHDILLSALKKGIHPCPDERISLEQFLAEVKLPILKYLKEIEPVKIKINSSMTIDDSEQTKKLKAINFLTLFLTKRPLLRNTDHLKRKVNLSG